MRRFIFLWALFNRCVSLARHFCFFQGSINRCGIASNVLVRYFSLFFARHLSSMDARLHGLIIHGDTTKATWKNHGPTMEAWRYHRPTTEAPWVRVQHASPTGPRWTDRGHTLWTNHGPTMEAPWKHHGPTVDPQWRCHGGTWGYHFMDPLWTNDGLTMNPPWTHHGGTMGILWNHHRPTTNPLCTHHGPTMDQ